MEKKQIRFKTKGMNRDLSASAFNPEFAFENKNLRVSANDGNSWMSWVNEKGTSFINIYQEDTDGTPTSTVTTLYGVPIGTAIINHYLILFTTDGTYDHIYRLKYCNADKTQMSCLTLYSGHLNFSTNYPLETLVSYEAEDIQKVYWTDGLNQPRLINIVLDPSEANYNDTSFDFIPTLQLNEEISIQKVFGESGVFPSGVIQYAFTYYKKYGQESNIFYTSPLLYISPMDRGAAPDEKVANAFRISVRNFDTNFDYIRVYSIIRTSIDTVPFVRRVQDLQISEEGNYSIVSTPYSIGSRELPFVFTEHYGWESIVDQYSTIQLYHDLDNNLSDFNCYVLTKEDYPDLKLKVGNRLVTWGPDSNNDSAVFVSQSTVEEDPVLIFECDYHGTKGSEHWENLSEIHYGIEFTDIGTIGDSVDPTELLYKGGENISALTMEQKSNTLFFGNLEISREAISSTIKSSIAQSTIAESLRNIYPINSSLGVYPYANQLTSYKESNHKNSVPCGGFKTGDYYRCGVQFQYETGRWSEPIFIADKEITNKPGMLSNNEGVSLPILTATLSSSVVTSLTALGYKRARAVVVFPTLQDRVVLCQGVANSTMYTEEHRSNNKDLYAQSSWFFRPSLNGDHTHNNETVSPTSSSGLFLEYTENSDTYDPESIREVEIEGHFSDDSINSNEFTIDTNFLTLHSPDIEFEEQLKNLDFIDTKFRRIGKVSFQKTLSDINILTESPTASIMGGGFIHKSFQDDYSYGIVSGLFYEDCCIDDKDNNKIKTYSKQLSPMKWLVYPWQRNGSLNNDVERPVDMGTRTAVLKKKVISNLRIADTIYNDSYTGEDGTGTRPDPKVFYSDVVSILKFGDRFYEGNIDTMLVPENSDGLYFAFGEPASYTTNSSFVYNDGTKTLKTDTVTPFNSVSWWRTFSYGDANAKKQGVYKCVYRKDANNVIYRKWERFDGDDADDLGDYYVDLVVSKSPVRMKYKSSPHLAMKLKSGDGLYSDLSADDNNKSVLPIIEVVREGDSSDSYYRATMFGGKSDDAFRANKWIPCGEPVNMMAGLPCTIKYEYGDTYFQRWDCLKTYAFNPDDINQIVEIGSFMLESKINTDGRYDKNRGQLNNTYMSPQNFNLMNPVYSQVNNFFTYRILDEDTYKRQTFPNQITWTKTKTTGADVDAWTSITLASTLELDGDKGQISSLQRCNDQLICFQDRGVSQILYDERVQIASTEGVPIEIANSGKVQGFSYISNTIGCSNKWSIANTPSGLYFIDSNDKGIFHYGGQLSNVSVQKGFNSWCKKTIPAYNVKWTPNLFKNFITHYDKLNQDVMFINKEYALAYSERFGMFTSFYSYERSPYFCNLDDTGVWIKVDVGNSVLYKHQSGLYCNFFGVDQGYSTTLVGNPEPMLDKMFTNLEFRASVSGEGTYDGINDKFTPSLPFDKLEVWNEYQHGITALENKTGSAAMQHSLPNGSSALKRKFRIWRCDIPRDNVPKTSAQPAYAGTSYTKDVDLGITRYSNKPLDRMRNPWIYLKLAKNPVTGADMHKAEIHDVVMTYFV